MAFNVYDGALTRVGEIKTLLSSTWAESYADRGASQIVVANSEQASKLLTVGRFIGQSGKKTLWQIKTREKRDGALWINGYTANYTQLEDRIYAGTHTSGTIETDLRAAVSGSRPASIVGLSGLRGLTGVCVSEHTYPTLFELAKDLCGTAEYGFRFLHDRENAMLLFDVYEGQEKPNAKFSERWGNLANLVLLQSDTDYKNVAYVGGEDRDAARTYVCCGQTALSGLARREMFIDARDIRKEDGQSQSDYESLLAERGLQKLNEHNQKLSVSFDVDPADFGVTYDLGDVIYCVLPEDGLKLFVRVIAFEETIEDNKKSLSITIGSPIIQTIGG